MQSPNTRAAAVVTGLEPKVGAHTLGPKSCSAAAILHSTLELKLWSINQRPTTPTHPSMHPSTKFTQAAHGRAHYERPPTHPSIHPSTQFTQAAHGRAHYE
eukprot:351958-Chlamydomonas_euryale.AAC.6